jgi:hypothetical protein
MFKLPLSGRVTDQTPFVNEPMQCDNNREGIALRQALKRHERRVGHSSRHAGDDLTDLPGGEQGQRQPWNGEPQEPPAIGVSITPTRCYQHGVAGSSHRLPLGDHLHRERVRPLTVVKKDNRRAV